MPGATIARQAITWFSVVGVVEVGIDIYLA